MTTVAASLRDTEERLRAAGLTGSRAFDALVDALRHRLGEDVAAHPVATDALRDLPEEDVDLLGLAYERFFSDLFKGSRGQYFTPRPLVEWMLDGLEPGETVLDPTCGSGGFLVCAARRGARVSGIERDPNLAALARVNLGLARQPGTIRCEDAFLAEVQPVDLVVANPPFSVRIDDPAVRERLGPVSTSDAAFLHALGAWVRPGGRAVVILPSSIAHNPRSQSLREVVTASFAVERLAELPEGVFRPFGGAAGRAVILWLRRRPCVDGPIQWSRVTDPGWDVRSQKHRATGSLEIEHLRSGLGWRSLPSGPWTRATPQGDGLPVSELASMPSGRPRPKGPSYAIDLGDVDRAHGTVTPRPVDAPSGIALEPGDLLVSRMRPELGNVAMADIEADRPLCGSAEWVALRAHRFPHHLLMAMRTPHFRAQIPGIGGQTRPRTTATAVGAARIRWPGDAVARRVDDVVRDLRARDAVIRVALTAIQSAVDAHAAGALDDAALDHAVEDVTRRLR